MLFFDIDSMNSDFMWAELAAYSVPDKLVNMIKERVLTVNGSQSQNHPVPETGQIHHPFPSGTNRRPLLSHRTLSS